VPTFEYCVGMILFHSTRLSWVLGSVVAQDVFQKESAFLAQRGLTMETVHPSEANLTAQTSSDDSWYKMIGPGDGTSNLCIDLPGGDARNGNPLWLWECNGHDTQTWVFSDYQLRFGQDETMCIDAGDQSDGMQLMLWECNGSPQQTWGYESGQILIAGGNACMDKWGDNWDSGQDLHVWECSGADNQQWGLFDTDQPNLYPAWPRDKCQFNTDPAWPAFATQADLENDQWWSVYFINVYGEIPTWGYPICPGAFQFLWQGAVKNSGVVTTDPIDCAPNAAPTYKGEGDELAEGSYYVNNAFLDAQEVFSFIYNSGLRGRHVPRNHWVEVIHTVFPGDIGVAWYYMAVGSGVWFNVGETAVYNDHADAMAIELNGACIDSGQNTWADVDPVSSIGATECENNKPKTGEEGTGFKPLWEAVLSQGRVSVQFLNHYDCTCGPQGDSSYKYDRHCPTEIVDLQDTDAENPCSNLLRGGWEAGKDCGCNRDFKSLTKNVDEKTGAFLYAGYSNCGAW